MTRYKLRIELLTPLGAGSGVGRAGSVDREVPLDRYGIPHLPGKRLKGLWRDALSTLLAALEADPAWAPVLFGEIGDGVPAPVHVRTATLPQADPLTPWLQWVKSEQERLSSNVGEGNDEESHLTNDEVVALFTEIRRQTRIGRNGAPVEDTLRSVRLIPRGYEFSAEIEASGLDPAAEQLLAASAAAIQSMGTSRSRGVGQVDCSLWKDGENITKPAIEAIEGKDWVPPLLAARPAPAVAPLEQPGEAIEETLRFRIRTQAASLFFAGTGDPNLVGTLDFIPGSSLHGLFAQRMLARGGVTDEFRKLFCSGEVQFLSAYPEIEPDERALPLPLAFRKRKTSEVEYLSAIEASNDDMQGTKRARGQWAQPLALLAEDAYAVSVRRRYQYHHQRPPEDVRIGRAVGADPAEREKYDLEPTKSGNLFTYEQIEAGQSFIGAIMGRADLLARLRTLVKDKDPVDLGRSKSGEYGGGALWEWLPAVEGGSEADSWLGAEEKRFDEPSQDLLMVALSPVLGVETNGQPAAKLPWDELGLEMKDSIDGEWARVTVHSSYLSHQRMLRQQRPGFAMGSCWRLRLPVARSAAELNHRFRFGIGARRELGCGRIGFYPLPVGQFLLEPRPPVAPERVEPPSEARPLFKARLQAAVNQRAIELAGGTEFAQAENHVLFRLKEMTQRGDLNSLKAELGKLRKRAQDQLERCRVKLWNREIGLAQSQEHTLVDFFHRVCGGDGLVFYEKIATEVGHTLHAARNPLLDARKEERDELLRYFLRCYISALIWRKRHGKRTSKKVEKKEVPQ
jgi:CRISPR-associated protein Csx10